jgi:formylglycine-generating enzyme required for sulfatase activity
MITWTETGPQFTAGSEYIETEFFVDTTGRYFRLRDLGEGNTDQPRQDPLTISDLGMTLMPIPAGTFVIGSPSSEVDRRINENPQTTVLISKNYWLGSTEVTKSQWISVMGNNPSYFTGNDNLPVEQVSWFECNEFCEKLNELYKDIIPDGFKFSLPTEAQWE